MCPGTIARAQIARRWTTGAREATSIPIQESGEREAHPTAHRTAAVRTALDTAAHQPMVLRDRPARASGSAVSLASAASPWPPAQKRGGQV